MHGIAASIAKTSGHYGRGMPHGREIAADLKKKLVMTAAGAPHGWGGHSEEHMIQHFPGCLAQCTSVPTSVIIWNSDTPCRNADRNPSESLGGGWPTSCSQKLNMLATRYPQYTFMVHFRKSFGGLNGQSLAQAAATLRGEVGATNLRFIPFSDGLQAQSAALQ